MKYRTDFVTNSSSSSFTVQIGVQLNNGETIKFENSSDDGQSEGPFTSVYVNLSPRKMGNVRSIDELVEMIVKGVISEEYSEIVGDVVETSVFSENSPSEEAKQFIARIRNIPSMEEIQTINIAGTEFLSNEIDHLDITYDRQDHLYQGKRYGHEIDEYPNGGCGGQFRIPDEDECEIEDVYDINGKTICECCYKAVDPKDAVFARDTDSERLHYFCGWDCYKKALHWGWFDEEDIEFEGASGEEHFD